MNGEHEYDQSVAYQIRLKGVLDPSWSDWLGGFSITIEGAETVLVGIVPDQAALHGILAKINELGLAIILVSQLPHREQED